ncbi:hypothetical protein EG68_05248 [Paragonimus skrjabini miyazakii]|uniref:Uncharacterized protein n=1 Tax=Paragonimus skrjabini miyazakii TaxID=59628 RepID=A0A8S9YWQ2_9TREM|nr:hypothetical protein EG68_05248 [Paragonimus skrjabini miyazakii]
MCEPADLNNWREVLVLIFYPRARAMAYRNAAIKEKAVIRNYKGMNIGYTEQIQHFEGDWDDRVCVGILKFANTRLTKLWLESDHPFRQQDFLDQVEILIVPLQKNDMSQKGYPIIEITNLHLSFKDLYETKYLPELECLVQKFGGVPLIVCQNEPWKWRAVDNPGSISINQWPDWQSYERYCAREETKKLDDMRKTIGNGYKITAELITDM